MKLLGEEIPDGVEQEVTARTESRFAERNRGRWSPSTYSHVVRGKYSNRSEQMMKGQHVKDFCFLFSSVPTWQVVARDSGQKIVSFALARIFMRIFLFCFCTYEIAMWYITQCWWLWKNSKDSFFLPRNACRFSSLVYLTHLYVSFESRSSYHGHDLVLGLFAKLLFPCPDGANTQRVNSWVLLFMVCFFICGFYFVKAFTPGLLSFLFSGTFFFLTVETWKIPPLNVTRKESFIRSFYRFCILLFETEPVFF
jgi:hypothetical protein